MLIVIVHLAPPRLRGFLASVMLEMDAGVYFTNIGSPRLRERIHDVVAEWSDVDSSALFIYHDPASPGKLAFQRIGQTPIAVKEVDGMLLAKKK